MTCDLCKEIAVDSIVFEAGSNANFRVLVQLCQAHCKEADETECAFQEKYATQIEEALYASWTE